MISLNIEAYIPRKPHDFGLLFHGICARLLNSQLHILVEWCPRLSLNKLTPTNALLTMIRRLEARYKMAFVVNADSGFASQSLLKPLNNIQSKFICSLNSSILPSLRGVGVQGLRNGQSRTFNNGNILVQVQMKQGHVNFIGTNNADLHNYLEEPIDIEVEKHVNDSISRKLYHIFASSINDPALLAALLEAPSANLDDILSTIKTKYEFDLLQPPPESNSTTWNNADELEKLTIPYLKVVCQRVGMDPTTLPLELGQVKRSRSVTRQ
jgi:hypothetical protein